MAAFGSRRLWMTCMGRNSIEPLTRSMSASGRMTSLGAPTGRSRLSVCRFSGFNKRRRIGADAWPANTRSTPARGRVVDTRSSYTPAGTESRTSQGGDASRRPDSSLTIDIRPLTAASLCKLSGAISTSGPPAARTVTWEGAGSRPVAPVSHHPACIATIAPPQIQQDNANRQASLDQPRWRPRRRRPSQPATKIASQTTT